MKRFFFISTVLNLGLVGVIAYRTTLKPAPPPSAEPAPATQVSLLASKLDTVIRTQAIAVVAPRFSWRDVESEDYKTYIANLRAIECPEETVRDIILADVNKFYLRKIAGLRKNRDTNYKYWKTGNDWGGGEGPEFQRAYRDTEKEKKELLRQLLGIDYAKEMARQWGWENPEDQDSFNATLSQEKKDRIQEINEKYQDLQQEVHRKARGYHDEDVQNELKEIEKQKRAELGKVLSPLELEEFDVRSSQLSQELRWQLEGFDASEQEFRAIVKARQAAEDSESGRRGKEVENPLKTALGESRYKEYMLAQDWEYKNLVRLSERQGLGKEAAVKVFDMKKEAEDVVRKIRSDQTLTQDQQKERLKAIRAETEKAVTETIGEKGFKSYKRNAWWIRNISPAN